ncbi:hypothetical protein BSY240_4733 (plasmid) [Agrobacterium sp. RAC06]|nr:hypothetical protein BSY240_4733 [Agrobacterium sp. RAC06]
MVVVSQVMPGRRAHGYPALADIDQRWWSCDIASLPRL